VEPYNILSLWAAWEPFIKASTFAIGVGFVKTIQIVYDAWRQRRQDKEDDATAKRLSDEAEEIVHNRKLIDDRLQAEIKRITDLNNKLQTEMNDLIAHNIKLYQVLLEYRYQITTLSRALGKPDPVFENLHSETFKPRSTL
jgi:hypothetical protein